MMSNERAYQRARRDVSKVGKTVALLATRYDVKQKVRMRNQRATAITRSRSRRPAPSIVKQVLGVAQDLFRFGTGQTDLPGPMLGGVGAPGQLQAIGRQQLARIPLTARVIGGAAIGTAAAGALEAGTGRSPAGWVHELAGGIGRAPFKQSAPRRPQMASRGGLKVGQELPPSHVVVRTWQTFPGGPIFARLADGHIAVQKKDGTIKHFRPYRPVVIPRKWNARSMSRVATALKRQRKTAVKIMKITGGMPKGRG